MGDSATDEKNKTLEATATDDPAGTPDDKTEVKIVLEKAAGNGSQPDIDAIVRGRVNKLNKRFDAKDQENNQLTGDLATANQRNSLLQLQVDQLKSRPSSQDKPPDPNDFDDGAADPKYMDALNSFTDARISGVVQKQLAEHQQVQPGRVSEVKQQQHYQRAHNLGIDNYEALEAKAIDILGPEISRRIIDVAPNSERIMAYLGSNPEAAQYHRDQIDTNPLNGVWELASLRFADIASQPNPPPNPDTPLQGVSPTTTDDYDKKLEKHRETAAATGKMGPLMDFKRKNQRPSAAP